VQFLSFIACASASNSATSPAWKGSGHTRLTIYIYIYIYIVNHWYCWAHCPSGTINIVNTCNTSQWDCHTLYLCIYMQTRAPLLWHVWWLIYIMTTLSQMLLLASSVKRKSLHSNNTRLSKKVLMFSSTHKSWRMWFCNLSLVCLYNWRLSMLVWLVYQSFSCTSSVVLKL